MSYESLIALVAKKVGVSAALLMGICSHESANFTINYLDHDNGSPSFGLCMIKADTAKMLKYKGTKKELMDSKTNITIAAKYLKYQMTRYNTEDWLIITAAYNAGSYRKDKKHPGCPKNLDYVLKVKDKLDESLKFKLDCGE